MWATAIVPWYYKLWIAKGLPCPIETHYRQRQITEERWNTMCVCVGGGVGGACGYWKGSKWPSSRFFHHVPLSSSSCCSLTTIGPFPTHCLMVIYLAGKGSAFSLARSTVAAMAKKKKKEEPSRAASRKRSGRKWEKGTENISLVSVSPATLTLPPAPPLRCNGSEGLATDSEGREERITCQYLFPAAAWIETDTLHSLSLVPPPQSQFKSSTFVWDQEDLRESPGRKQTAMEDTEERFVFGAKRVSGWVTQTNKDFYGRGTGINAEWTFPIASLWKANSESKHRPGPASSLSHWLQALSSVWAVIPLGATGWPLLGNCNGQTNKYHQEQEMFAACCTCCFFFFPTWLQS